MTTNKKAKAVATGKKNKMSGEVAEAIAKNLLYGMGVNCLEKIEVGWRIERVGGRVVGATPRSKVSGDWRGLLPNGRSVLCEVKATAKDKLPISAFSPHQVIALGQHAESGGLSLVIWLARAPGVDARMFVLDFTEINFATRKNLTICAADKIKLAKLC